ncbi:putative JOSEPHIN-like protein [Melia azedarach]|uniref:JOSEPHIN-like protein n=1 Tax=Melia azedarach TaxID=155640 RepID=A0ACC1YR12_MELAZ|nr:putative JOSEPHIN-like protein [Melia azedarach]
MSTKVSNQASSRPGFNKEALPQKQNLISKVVGHTKSTESCGTRESNQVSCIPSIKKDKINKRNCINRVAVNKRSAGGCGIRLPKRSEVSPTRFFKHVSSKMARGLCFTYFKKTSSPAVSSSGRSKPSVIPVDSHRSEAIEDCIEFINSSSSLPRSNSVSTNAS